MEVETEPPPTGGKRCGRFFIAHWRGLLVVLVPLILLPLLFMKPVVEFACAYVLLIMAIYWITEALPLCVTALLPIVAFPMLGIMDSNSVCMAYFKDSLLLFFGGLILALAIEFSNLHKRVGLTLMILVGCSPRRLHFSMIVATAFISMWISNSAATSMICPIVKAVLEELERQDMLKLIDEKKKVAETDPPYPSKSVNAFYIGVAYAASIGGCGTLIGTGTNITFDGIYETMFPKSPGLGFVNFYLYNVLPVIGHTLFVFFWLQWLYMGLCRPHSAAAKAVAVTADSLRLTKQLLVENRQKMGPITAHEIQVSVLFFVMIALFVTRKPGLYPGWADYLNRKEIKDSGAMFIVVFLLFGLPVSYMFISYCLGIKTGKQQTMTSLVTWSYVQQNMPWSIVLLLGGGAALSAGIKESGLTKLIGDQLGAFKHLPNPVTMLLCMLFALVATNFTANVAICNIFSPIFLQLAVSINAHPLYLGLPTAMAFSMAFHFPVSTPPNAIAAGFANLRTKDMMIAGIGPSLMTIVSYFLVSQFFAELIFPQFKGFPDWAKP